VRIADYAATDLIATGLEAHDKDDLLQKMVEMLVQSGRVRQSDILMGELQKRERVMSTGIGGGHERTARVRGSRFESSRSRRHARRAKVGEQRLREVAGARLAPASGGGVQAAPA
jgi:hypothetical protein